MDGLSSFSKLAASHKTDCLKRRRPLVQSGCVVTTLATGALARWPFQIPLMCHGPQEFGGDVRSSTHFHESPLRSEIVGLLARV